MPVYNFKANGLRYSNLESEYETVCVLFLRPTLSARYVEPVVVVHVAASDIPQTAPRSKSGRNFKNRHSIISSQECQEQIERAEEVFRPLGDSANKV